MHPLSQFLAYFAFTQMVMCIVFLVPAWKKNQAVRLFQLLLVSGSGYWLTVILPDLENNSFLWWIQFLAGNALPGLFWLVGLSVFGEHFELKIKHYLIASLTLFIPGFSLLIQGVFSVELVTGSTIYNLIKYGAMAIELTLILHALIIALKYWRDDLVQERRYIRGGVISFTGVYLVLIIVVEQIFHLHWQGFELLKTFLLASLITGINLLLFTLRESSIFSINTTQVSPEIREKPVSKEITSILDSMVNEKLYQQDGLTISVFAQHLSIHEYKLRKLINVELQYRNFNDFLNFYRILEVTEKLDNKEDTQLPILTLALESGFRSLSSFNKAFKNKHGITPSEYRKIEHG